jgi:hypothetical protein
VNLRQTDSTIYELRELDWASLGQNLMADFFLMGVIKLCISYISSSSSSSSSSGKNLSTVFYILLFNNLKCSIDEYQYCHPPEQLS